MSSTIILGLTLLGGSVLGLVTTIVTIIVNFILDRRTA